MTRKPGESVAEFIKRLQARIRKLNRDLRNKTKSRDAWFDEYMRQFPDYNSQSRAGRHK